MWRLCHVQAWRGGRGKLLVYGRGTLILVGAHQDALREPFQLSDVEGLRLEELILHDARARIQELKAPEVAPCSR